MSDRSSLVELQQELEWRKCAKDEAYFLRTYWQIQHPSRGSILFDLREAQEIALKHWAENRYSLTLKARQIGWSTLCAAHVAWLALFHSDQNIILISRTEREAVLLLKKAKHGYGRLPKWMQERGPTPTVDHQQKMVFDNGSQIVSMPSAADPARGESASLVIVDEWAFLPNAEDAWASIEPVADVGGRIIGLSTANGYGNFYHTLWVGAETGNNNFSTMFFPWSANGERDKAWYEAKKRGMLPWQLAQEYPTTPEEAFIQSGRPVFGGDILDHVEVEQGLEGQLVELAPKNYEFRANTEFTSFRSDAYEVWEAPNPQEAYVFGADVAEGLEHGDFSSAHVVALSTGLVVATYHAHIEADLFGDELFKLGWWYNAALAGVEINNHGLTTVTALRRLGYPRIYRRRRLNSSAGATPTMEFGWRTDKTTKPLMIDELAMDLRNGELGLRCGYTLGELRTYQRDERGGMSGAPFDDRVISLAIANQMRKYAQQPEYAQKTDDYWTIDWWARQGTESSSSSATWRLGGRSCRSRPGTR